MRRVVLIPINKGKGTYTADDNYFIVSDNKVEATDSVTEEFVNEQISNTIATLYSNYIIPVVSAGASISFDILRQYGTPSSPSAGDFSNNLSSAKKGLVQKIYHSDTTEPSLPEGWVRFAGEYKPNELNIIYAEWAGDARIEYWIINEPE